MGQEGRDGPGFVVSPTGTFRLSVAGPGFLSCLGVRSHRPTVHAARVRPVQWTYIKLKEYQCCFIIIILLVIFIFDGQNRETPKLGLHSSVD